MSLVVSDSGPIQYITFLNLPAALQKLLHTNLRVDAEVIRESLERDAKRQRCRVSHPREHGMGR